MVRLTFFLLMRCLSISIVRSRLEDFITVTGGHRGRVDGLLGRVGDDGLQDLIADLVAVRQDLAHVRRGVIHTQTERAPKLDLVDQPALARGGDGVGRARARDRARWAGRVEGDGRQDPAGIRRGPSQLNSSSTVTVTESDAVWPLRVLRG